MIINYNGCYSVFKTSAKLQNTHHTSACFDKKNPNKVYFFHLIVQMMVVKCSLRITQKVQDISKMVPKHGYAPWSLP